MIKHNMIKLSIAILVALIAATIFTFTSLAISYWFEPSSNYTQNDARVLLHTYGYSYSTPYVVRVDWFDPQGHQVYCSGGGQGVCWDQSVADNGVLIWRDFYLPIQGQSLPSGTYTAIAYSYQSYIYTELFRTNFSISGTPAPTPIPLTGVVINGPTTGWVNTTYTFTAAVNPPAATTPITYTWSPGPNSGQGSAIVTYIWGITGTQTITVTAENIGGIVSDTHAVSIGELRFVYLPLILH